MGNRLYSKMLTIYILVKGVTAGLPDVSTVNVVKCYLAASAATQLLGVICHPPVKPEWMIDFHIFYLINKIHSCVHWADINI